MNSETTEEKNKQKNDPEEKNGPELSLVERVEGLMDRENKLESELADTRDSHLRLRAEFDNFRKRKNREAQEIVKNANENLIADLLWVLDDFDLAMKSARETDGEGSIIAGIEIIIRKFTDILSKYELSEIDAQDKDFDPQVHEALAFTPSEDTEKEVVAEVFQKGYMLNDRVLRPAKVRVAGPPKTKD
jgi:molecular chaperone GrpE